MNSHTIALPQIGDFEVVLSTTNSTTSEFPVNVIETTFLLIMLLAKYLQGLFLM